MSQSVTGMTFLTFWRKSQETSFVQNFFIEYRLYVLIKKIFLKTFYLLFTLRNHFCRHCICSFFFLYFCIFVCRLLISLFVNYFAPMDSLSLFYCQQQTTITSQKSKINEKKYFLFLPFKFKIIISLFMYISPFAENIYFFPQLII